MNREIHTEYWSDLQKWLWEEAATWMSVQDTGTDPLVSAPHPEALGEALLAKLKEHGETLENVIRDWAETGLWSAVTEEQAKLMELLIWWAGLQFEFLGNLEREGWLPPPPPENELPLLVASMLSADNRSVWWTGVSKLLDDLMEGDPLRLHDVERYWRIAGKMGQAGRE